GAPHAKAVDSRLLARRTTRTQKVICCPQRHHPSERPTLPFLPCLVRGRRRLARRSERGAVARRARAVPDRVRGARSRAAPPFASAGRPVPTARSSPGSAWKRSAFVAPATLMRWPRELVSQVDTLAS